MWRPALGYRCQPTASADGANWRGRAVLKTHAVESREALATVRHRLISSRSARLRDGPFMTEPDTVSIKCSPKHARLAIPKDRCEGQNPAASALPGLGAAFGSLLPFVATRFPAAGGRRFAINPARAPECVFGHPGGRVLIVTQQPAKSQSATSFCLAPFQFAAFTSVGGPEALYDAHRLHGRVALPHRTVVPGSQPRRLTPPGPRFYCPG
jgi:hypothetical protein